MAAAHTNSGAAPAVAIVIGLVLLFTTRGPLNLLGALLVLGGGVLFIVRVIAMLARSAKNEGGPPPQG